MCTSGVTALGDMLSVGRVWADREGVIERMMTLILTKQLMRPILAVDVMVRAMEREAIYQVEAVEQVG